MNTDHILFPSDLSPESLRPLEMAPELFAGKRVTLLSVVENLYAMDMESPLMPSRVDPSLESRTEYAQEALTKLAAQIPDATSIEIETTIGMDVGRTVAEWAEDHDVGMIALSTHGRRGIRRLFMGSVADRILRYATVPVLVFPPSAT